MLKFLRADSSQNPQEKKINETLARPSEREHSSKFLTQLIRSFEVKGPNGLHTCLVFEPMGPSAQVMKEELPEFGGRKYNVDLRFPLPMAKSILKQVLQGLVYLHGKDICHGDVQPGNILFGVPQIESVEANDLAQHEAEDCCFPVKRLDGRNPAPSAPDYLVLDAPLVDFVDLESGFKIKLSDLGAAYLIGNLPEKDVTPLGLRAPEAIWSGKASPHQDMWSFGCLTFELLTGRQLFSVTRFGYNENEMNDSHMLQLFNTLPQNFARSEYLEKWDNAGEYFDVSSGKQTKSWIGEKMPELSESNSLPAHTVAKIERLKDDPAALRFATLGERLAERKPVGMSDDEAQEVKVLLERILQGNSEARPTAAVLLEDPWFAAIDVDAGKKKHSAYAAPRSYLQLAKRFVKRCVSWCTMI